MVRRILVATAAACCALSLGACGALSNLLPGGLTLGLPSPVHLTPDDSGAQVKVAHGQQLIVRLPALPASGYGWALREPMSAVVKPEGPPSFEKAEAANAASATEVWIFTPVRDGQQQLRFENRRASQVDAPPAGVVSYNISVR